MDRASTESETLLNDRGGSHACKPGPVTAFTGVAPRRQRSKCREITPLYGQRVRTRTGFTPPRDQSESPATMQRSARSTFVFEGSACAHHLQTAPGEGISQ